MYHALEHDYLLFDILKNPPKDSRHRPQKVLLRHWTHLNTGYGRLKGYLHKIGLAADTLWSLCGEEGERETIYYLNEVLSQLKSNYLSVPSYPTISDLIPNRQACRESQPTVKGLTLKGISQKLNYGLSAWVTRDDHADTKSKSSNVLV